MIELVMVLVIVAILAAIGASRYMDLNSQAKAATKTQIAAALTSGSAANLAALRAGSPGAATLNQTNICNAANMSSLIQGGSLPRLAGYAVMVAPTPAGDCSGSNDKVVCNLRSFNPDSGLFESFPVDIYCAR